MDKLFYVISEMNIASIRNRRSFIHKPEIFFNSFQRGASTPEGKIAAEKLKGEFLIRNTTTFIKKPVQEIEKFVRRSTNFHEKFNRKLISKQKKLLPSPIRQKQLDRDIMNPEERSLMESLYQDQQKNKKDMSASLNSAITNCLRSKHRKINCYF